MHIPHHYHKHPIYVKIIIATICILKFFSSFLANFFPSIKTVAFQLPSCTPSPFFFILILRLFQCPFPPPHVNILFDNVIAIIDIIHCHVIHSIHTQTIVFNEYNINNKVIWNNWHFELRAGCWIYVDDNLNCTWRMSECICVCVYAYRKWVILSPFFAKFTTFHPHLLDI